MLLLDFTKAYDLVNHQYLLAILAAMGFSPLFVNLVKGLITCSSAKVHFNGLFKGDFH
jgi:hypothetical protein